jgi:hypothetical protein
MAVVVVVVLFLDDDGVAVGEEAQEGEARIG